MPLKLGNQGHRPAGRGCAVTARLRLPREEAEASEVDDLAAGRTTDNGYYLFFIKLDFEVITDSHGKLQM